MGQTHIVKPETVKHRTTEHGMPEHQIRNGKTLNTESRMVKTQNPKSGTVKPVILNLENEFTET